MRQPGFNIFLWSIFGILIAFGAYAALNACDLGIRPLFGSLSCQAPVANVALDSERARETQLLSRIQTAEIHLALLPACPKPLPQPQPLPVKGPDPKPPIDNQAPVQTLEVPKKIEDLKGCYQSVRGDIEITTDDAEQKPMGEARICYCFRSNGRGQMQARYTDGDICRAELIARIVPGQLIMHHDKATCRRHSYLVAADIRCGNSQSERTECEIQNRGEVGNRFTEPFMHVSDEYCGWKG